MSNRYVLHEQLGHGGMGTVYKATDRLSGNFVALKHVSKSTSGIPDQPGNKTLSNRVALAQEFKVLASLHHPNIIGVMDYGFDTDQPYFTMQYIEDARLITDSSLHTGITATVFLLIDLLHALTYLHRRGLIHRDIKPGNVLVTQDRTVKVLDFGLASQQGEASGQTVGTLTHMAPEVLRGNAPTQQSDLYSVGIIAYEILTQSYPFNNSSMTTLITDIVNHPIPIEHESIPVELQPIIARLVAKSPAVRYSSAMQVIDELCGAMEIPVPQESVTIRESYLQGAQFIGREAEFKQITDVLNQIVNASEPVHLSGIRNHAWLISGESGVGKSRLVEELRTYALVRRVTVLHGQAITERGVPYHIWRQPLRQLALSSPLTGSEARILHNLIPDITQLSNLQLQADAVPEDISNQEIVSVILELFRRYNRPLLLILEDLQWTNEESRAILRQLTRIAHRLPLLIVANYRDDEAPEIPKEFPDMETMKLERLSDKSIAELSASMLGDAGKQPDVVDLLQRETEGNIFFLIEFVRSLAEDAGRLSLIGQMTLPRSLTTGNVENILKRRLAQLTDEQQMLLKKAAVIGRQFDMRILHHMISSPDQSAATLDIEGWLMTCANASILERVGEDWRFSHDKLREYVLDTLLDEEIAILHRQAGTAIEQIYNTLDDPNTLHALNLYQHWAAAGDTVKEGHYAIIAGKQKENTSNHREAIQLFERALALDAYQQTANPRKAHADLLHDLGRAQRGLSHLDEAREIGLQALSIYEELGDQTGIGLVKGLLCEADLWQGNYARARQLAEESIDIYQSLGDYKLIGHALFNLGIIQWNQDSMTTARDTFNDALEMMVKSGDRRQIARALNNLGTAEAGLGNVDIARGILNESLSIRREIKDHHGIAYALSNIAGIESDLGNYDRAKELHQESLELLRDVGEKHAIASTLSSLGQIARRHDQDYILAEQYYTEALELRREIRSHAGIATSLHELGQIAFDRSDYPTAMSYYRDALTQAIQIDAFSSILGTLTEISKVFSRQKQPQYSLQLLAYIHNNLGESSSLSENVESLLAELQSYILSPTYEQLFQQGASMTLEQIAEIVMSDGENL